MNEFLQKSVLVIYLIQITTGQLSTVEELRNVTECEVGVVNIDCGSSMIALDSIVFRYDATCDSTCCNFNSGHCSDNAIEADISYARRDCSWKSTCSLDLRGARAFCSLGTHEPSYVTIYFYCIPAERTSSICSSSSLQSPNLPLYLTSKDYPDVTTGDSTCSCSLEIYNCTSSFSMYILDADLYLDTSTCEQTIEIRDNLNNILHEIKCESYYTSDLTTYTLNKHYITINFLDSSNANQEGFFFFGFSASARNTQFTLSCSSISETRCVDCSSSIDVENGNASLTVENDSSNGATAIVECNEGYNTTNPTIRCLDTGTWEESTCTEVEDNEDDKDADTNKKDGGGWEVWKIVLTVIGVIASIIIIVVFIKYLLKQNNVGPYEQQHCDNTDNINYSISSNTPAGNQA